MQIPFLGISLSFRRMVVNEAITGRYAIGCHKLKTAKATKCCIVLQNPCSFNGGNELMHGPLNRFDIYFTIE